MYCISLTIPLMLVLGAFGTASAENIEEISEKVELMPQDEYLIGEDTPIYFLRNISGKLIVYDNVIKNVFTASQKHKFAKAATSRVTLSTEAQRTFSTESKTTNQYVLRPEILVIVDYDLYSHFDYNYELIFPYVVTFWNAVDLKFRILTSVQYRLNIAGIIVAETNDALSYINRGKHTNHEGSFLSAKKSLEASSKWLYENNDKFPMLKYDIAITMTANKLCSGRNADMSTRKKRTYGLTYEGGACHHDDLQRKTLKTAIVQNEGAYDKVIMTARTISLLMSNRCDFRNCDSNKYDIVDTRDIVISSNWSDDQVTHLLYFVGNMQNSYCLVDDVDRGKKMPTYLPGEILDANEQCKRLGYVKTDKVDDSICTRLTCITKNQNNHEHETSEAHDGTTCGRGRICLNSQCVSIVEWKMYKYQQPESF